MPKMGLQPLLGTIFAKNRHYIRVQGATGAIWNFCKNCLSCDREIIRFGTFLQMYNEKFN